MLHSNIYNMHKIGKKEKRVKSEPIYIIGKTVSYNPGSTPNTPINTPPNINVIRELYLDYLTSFKK